jgi:hypothetical protein
MQIPRRRLSTRAVPTRAEQLKDARGMAAMRFLAFQAAADLSAFD